MGTQAVTANIREGKTHQIPSLMQTGLKQGMVLLNDAMLKLVKAKQVDPKEAYLKVVDKEDFVKKLQLEGIRLDLGVPAAAAAAG